jgi:hypothetical protein
MAENTVEVTLWLNVDGFQRSIKAGAGAGEIRGLKQITTTGSKRISDSMRRIGVRPFADINREIRTLHNDYNPLSRSGELTAKDIKGAATGCIVAGDAGARGSVGLPLEPVLGRASPSQTAA